MVGRCAHCRKRRKLYEWFLRACADKAEERTVYLCGPCDVVLNRYVLHFFNEPDAEQKLQEYARRG